MPKKDITVEHVKKEDTLQTSSKTKPVRKITVTNLKQRNLILPYGGSHVVFKGLETQELVYDAESFKVLKQYENLKFIMVR